MLNFYNPRGSATGRKCSNPKCPYMMAEKVVSMCDILSIKGIGAKSAFKIIKSHECKTHFETLPYIVNTKPSVTLYTFMRLCLIEGVDTSWENVVAGYDKVEDFLNNYKGDYRNIVDANIDTILSGTRFVDIVNGWRPEFKPKLTGTVMISGNIRGFNNRNDFIYGINTVTKGIVRLSVAESKRKTGILALIQESDTPNRGKAECALENNIPIMTPDEFQKYIGDIIQRESGNLEREVY
jgi:hypothetical protein